MYDNDKVEAHGMNKDIFISFSQSLSLLTEVITMENICPFCSKNTFANKKALKRHTDSCELTFGPARKSTRKSSQPEPVQLIQDNDLEKLLSSSCPFNQ